MAPQYKSKHANYVRLSNLVLKPLDTHSWYPNRECPQWCMLNQLFRQETLLCEVH